MKLRLVCALCGLIGPAAFLSATTFQDWQTASFTTEQLGNSAVSGPTSDPDGDGVANLHEYAFFGQPLNANQSLTPSLSRAAGHLVLTYRERHALTDVAIRLQGSDTLSNWITYNTVTEADRETFTDYDEVTVIDPQPFDQARRFLRLRVELLPPVEPQAPTQLSLKVVTPTSWSVGWTDPNVSETAYAVEHRLPTNVWQRLGTLGADTGGWQHMAANYQTSMTYRVVAIGGGGAEAASTPITLPDTDGDGIPNALELGEGYKGVSGTYASDPEQFSSNDSGISDGWLAANGFDPANHDASLDSDGDGLSDAEEAARGTNPHNDDTDQDGVFDAEDGWPRTAWIITAPLPDVRYAVVRLQSLGWPADRAVGALDDNGGVLGGSYYFRPGIDPATGGVAVPITNTGANHSGRLSKDGLVSASVFIGQTPYLYKAKSWRLGDTVATSYEAQETFSGMTTTDIQTVVTGSSNGRTVVVEQGVVYRTSPAQNGRYASVRIYSGGASSLVGQRVEHISSGGSSTDTGASFAPLLINHDGVMAGYPFTPADLGQLDAAGPASIWENGQVTNFSGVPIALPDSIPRVFIGAAPLDEYDIDNMRVYWAHKQNDAWVSEDLQVWDPLTYQNRYPWSGALHANARLEMISGSELIRNGQFVSPASYTPAGWSDIYFYDINNHGVILANATRTLDDQGLPITNSQPESVLLMPIEITSEDRLVKGAITIPEGWTNVALSFRSTAQGGLDLGTFSGLEPGVADSPTYIYASEDAILAEAELDEAQSAILDPRTHTQAVVFYRDAENPRRLHFATAFDQVGDIEISLSFGAGTTPVAAKLAHTLVAHAEVAGLLSIIDQRIEAISIPELPDFDFDLDGDGVPDGGSTDLLAACQPGTMAAPGPFVSEKSEDDPLNLVLLVNSDDDNTDSLADSLHTDLAATDDDLARIVLRAPSSLSSPEGTLTLTHTGGPSLRLRFATGPPVASGTSVNLASPSGVLAGLATGAVTLYAEGLAPASDVTITLTYTPATGDPVADTVHLTVIDPASLASLQTRHRYFTLPGDLGGLASRAYAANGAYRQHRLGLAPIGENLPLQNRGLLAKVLLPLTGGLKGQAAYFRGIADGFWLGLKGDGESMGDAFFYVFMEDNRFARAKALAIQFGELAKIYYSIPPWQRPIRAAQLGGTLIRGLYTEAEAELGWDPLLPGIDPQVLSYMMGIGTGFVTEQVAVALIPIGGTAAVLTGKVGLVLRGVIAATATGERYILPAFDATVKASAKVTKALSRIGRSEEEVRNSVQAAQMARRVETTAGKAPLVLDELFKAKPQLGEDILKIWQDALPAAAVAGPKRFAYMEADMARMLARFGGEANLSDDAIKGFAYLQGSLFKVGEDSASRWVDLEKLLGGLDTAQKKLAFEKTLVELQRNVASGESLPSWVRVAEEVSEIHQYMYHYIDADQFRFFDVIESGLFQKRSNPAGTTYVSPDIFQDSVVAKAKLQIPDKPGVTAADRARYRCKLATQEISSDIRITPGYDLANNRPLNCLEPLARDNPQFGAGGGRQFTTSLRLIISEIWDIKEGRKLTDPEIFNLINQFN